MQTAAQVIPSEFIDPDANDRLGEFAHELAKTHGVLGTAPGSHSKKTDLLEFLKSWDLALRNAYKIFKSAPASDLPDGVQSPQRPMGKKTKPKNHFMFGKLRRSLS